MAIGAALLSEKYGETTLGAIVNALDNIDASEVSDTKHIEPLFESEADYAEFTARHAADKVKTGELAKASGRLYLGIDAGSTTTKSALIDEDNRVLYSFYKNNEGKPLETVLEMLKDLYARIPEDAYIARAAATGYGEGLTQGRIQNRYRRNRNNSALQGCGGISSGS